MNGTDFPTGSPQATASGTPKRPHDASSPAATRTPPPADNLATARDATALPAGDQDRLPGALVPDWPAPASIRSLVTTRLGGVGTGGLLEGEPRVKAEPPWGRELTSRVASSAARPQIATKDRRISPEIARLFVH